MVDQVYVVIDYDAIIDKPSTSYGREDYIELSLLTASVLVTKRLIGCLIIIYVIKIGFIYLCYNISLCLLGTLLTYEPLSPRIKFSKY